MRFPVYFNLFGLHLHPHPVMETIAYTLGFQLYLLLKKRYQGPTISTEKNLWLLVGAVAGALVGSKILAITESWPDYLDLWRKTHNPAAILGAKTIVGGLLGGWIGVEIAKKILDIRFSTGDLFVFPLILGMSIGRVGCFLTGLDDHTCGDLCNAPWAVNFGDGPRHPAQLYDIIFLCTLGLGLLLRTRRPYQNGRIFRLFVLFYCLYRWSIEFIKPTGPKYDHLSAIQLACAVAVCVTAWLLYVRPLVKPAMASPVQG